MKLKDFGAYIGPDGQAFRLVPEATAAKLVDTFNIVTLEKSEHGSRIKELRKSKGLSQGELGKLAGITQAEISRIESGDIKNPHTDTIKELYEKLQQN